MPHTGNIGTWGSSGWGSASWGGGGSGGVLTLLSILAVRENVFRLEFDTGVYFSRVLDPADASNTAKFTISAVAGTVGLDGNPVRPLLVVEVFVPVEADGIDPGGVGRFLDVIVDRPMTPYPALYDIAITDIHSADLLAVIPFAARRAPAVFKRVEPPRIDSTSPTRDLANAQTRSALVDSLPDPTDALNLGTFAVDDAGDYAFDEGLVSLRKRVTRRLVTRRGGFAHLPNYGVGIPDHGKRLAISSVIADLAVEAEAQIALEPDVAKVRVRALVDPNVPGLVRFQVLVKPRVGNAQRIEVPFGSG